MLRLTLQRKFFIALALLLAVLLALFVGLSRLGLQRGIGAYVAEIELSRLDWLVGNLQAAYLREGSWEFLRHDARAWHAVQMPGGALRSGARAWQGGPPPGSPPDGRDGGPPPRPEGPPPGHSGQVAPQLDVLPGRHAPPPPPDRPGDPRSKPDSIYNRLALLDADGNARIAGSAAAAAADTVRAPVTAQGRTVGWLALAPLQGIASSADRAFIAQQSNFVVVTGLAGLLLALLLSAAMARRWLRPLAGLVEGARSVADGRLDVQLPVRGDDEFTQLTRSFNAMSAKLAAIEQSRRQWLSDVAHELRTPVAAMRAEIEAVQDGVRNFDAATARRLHGQAMRLGQLVDDLRLVMQDAYEPGAAARETVRPLGLLAEAVEAARPRLAACGIPIEGLEQLQALDTAARPCLEGDPVRLTQLFVNLLENSLRYTDAPGRLRLGALAGAGPNRQLAITLEDTPPAPREGDLPRLFDRFFRGDASRDRASGGAGLGLAICKAIVQAHGGEIAASLSPLGGLCIRLTFPLHAP